ncbi:MAG: leucyl aminopeptidase [Opitutales bacterium]
MRLMDDLTRQENIDPKGFPVHLLFPFDCNLSTPASIMSYLSQVKHTDQAWSETNAQLVAVGIFEDQKLTPLGGSIDEHLDGVISKAVRLGDLTGKPGTAQTFYDDERQILVIGLGPREDFDDEAIRKAGGCIAKATLCKKLTSLAVECLCAGSDKKDCQALAEGLVLGSYRFTSYRTGDEDGPDLEEVTVLGGDEASLTKGAVIAEGVCLARDLGNHPGNVATPTRLAEEAQRIGEAGDMKVTVLEREEIIEMGMGALAAVAQGSDEPPKFIILEYKGGTEDQKPIALVGKGLTFDSGGISIKPSAKMDEMKFDMCGSAIVLGVMQAVATLKPALNLIGVIPSTENLLGAKACKPGDILTAYNGKTIEVLNTDAEGRLILADALSYVTKNHDLEYALDFATLTGAVLVALGHHATGIMGTDEDLIAKVKASADQTGEKVWEFPLWEEYCDEVKSKVADVKNLGNERNSGTIAGGAFLKEFVENETPWVHFDIAGTAWGEKEKPYGPKTGATGNVIRLVLDLLGV